MTRRTEIIMGMPITLDLPGAGASALEPVFELFRAVDRQFSPFRPDSEVTALNEGRLEANAVSPALREVLALGETTRRQTEGHFDVVSPEGVLDPSGIVKGWAIARAAQAIRAAGHADFLIEAGGDIQAGGVNGEGQSWRVGIRNPFQPDQIVQVIKPGGRGVATSGSYVRGAHIWNPLDPKADLSRVVSLTVIGPDALEADRFATAAFAMGEAGIGFIDLYPGLEGFMIDCDGMSTQTRGFAALTEA